MNETNIPLQDLRPATFAEFLHDCFRVRIDPGVVDLILIEINAFPPSENHPRREPFSIMFRGPASPRLSQGTYAFEHEAIGAFEIFIVPVVPDEHGPRYQAIFN
jgi:hypothetical protein